MGIKETAENALLGAGAAASMAGGILNDGQLADMGQEIGQSLGQASAARDAVEQGAPTRPRLRPAPTRACRRQFVDTSHPCFRTQCGSRGHYPKRKLY